MEKFFKSGNKKSSFCYQKIYEHLVKGIYKNQNENFYMDIDVDDKNLKDKVLEVLKE